MLFVFFTLSITVAKAFCFAASALAVPLTGLNFLMVPPKEVDAFNGEFKASYSSASSAKVSAPKVTFLLPAGGDIFEAECTSSSY